MFKLKILSFKKSQNTIKYGLKYKSAVLSVKLICYIIKNKHE